MRFHLVDRIVEVQPGKSLRAVKNLTLGEEYLADHFPTFPVMPGVLMLETLVEAGAWLLRATDDFRHSVIVLREAQERQVRHLHGAGPADDDSVELAEQDDGTATLQGQGRGRRPVDGVGEADPGPLQPARPRPGLAGGGRADGAAACGAVRVAATA